MANLQKIAVNVKVFRIICYIYRVRTITNGIVPGGAPAYYMQQRRAGKDPVFRRTMMPEDEADIECWE